MDVPADVVAGGYFIERPFEHGKEISARLPGLLPSASACLADIGPSLQHRDVGWASCRSVVGVIATL